MFIPCHVSACRGWRSWREKTPCWRVKRKKWTEGLFSSQRTLTVRANTSRCNCCTCLNLTCPPSALRGEWSAPPVSSPSVCIRSIRVYWKQPVSDFSVVWQTVLETKSEREKLDCVMFGLLVVVITVNDKCLNQLEDCEFCPPSLGIGNASRKRDYCGEKSVSVYLFLGIWA